MRRPLGTRVTTTITALALLLAAGCSDDGDITPPEPAVIEATAEADGNNQTATVGERLPNPLRVLVTRDDEPVEGLEVRWITQQGGRFNPQTSVSDAEGVAETFWTLGDAEGQQRATARLVDGDQTPVEFTAVATEPPPPPPNGGPPPALRAPH
jgi:hypothetical protein